MRAVYSRKTLVVARHRERRARHQQDLVLFKFLYEGLQVRDVRVIGPDEHAALRCYIELPASCSQGALSLDLLTDKPLLNILHVSGISTIRQNGVDEPLAERRNGNARQ